MSKIKEMKTKLDKKLIVPLAISVCVVLAIAASLFFLNYGKKILGPKTISGQEVGERIIKYVEQNIPEAKISLVGVTEENGLYKVNLKLNESEISVYATKNGKLFFPQAITLNEGLTNGSAGEVEKSDVPDIKLFVMSYCPFGLQAEKALLPAWELLREKVKIGVYFVDYIMHEKKEIDENLRQYCIQKEEPEKFTAYLSCFVKKGDYQACLGETRIDREKLNSCQEGADKKFKISENYNNKNSWLSGRYPKFEIDSELNKKYNVSGSPTLVINDQVVQLKKRSPEDFKKIICQAFVSPPEECSQTLSEETPSPGFGGGTGSSSGGTCG